MMNDYNFRGIPQSALKPSLYAYSEPRYNATPTGNSMESIDFANRAAAEVDFYDGIGRHLAPTQPSAGGR
jgi:hypothetical protein